MFRTRYILVTLLAVGAAGSALRAQNPVQPLTETPMRREALTPAPHRAQGEGSGPYVQAMVERQKRSRTTKATTAQ